MPLVPATAALSCGAGRLGAAAAQCLARGGGTHLLRPADIILPPLRQPVEKRKHRRRSADIISPPPHQQIENLILPPRIVACNACASAARQQQAYIFAPHSVTVAKEEEPDAPRLAKQAFVWACKLEPPVVKSMLLQ